MAAIVRLSPGMAAAGSPAVLAESALAILWPRRNRGDLAVRLSCRALIRRWLAVARSAA